VQIARQASTRGKIHLEKALPGIETSFCKAPSRCWWTAIPGRNQGNPRNPHRTDLSAGDVLGRHLPHHGQLSPAYGIIGTLIGLIGMMQSMRGGWAISAGTWPWP